MISSDVATLTQLIHAISSVNGTLEAVRAKDDLAMRARLRAVVLTYPQVDRVFMTDPSGVLWTDYPQAPGAFGADQSDTDWFRALAGRGKTVVSNVYFRPHDSSVSVMAIATPVRAATGSDLLGTLVFEVRTDRMRDWLQSVRLGQNGHVYLLDSSGIIAAHPFVDAATPLTDIYGRETFIRSAVGSGTFVTGEYDDPLAGMRMIAAVQPVTIGSRTWTVVAQQPVTEAYDVLDSVRIRISLAGLLLTLVTMATVVALALTERRNERLNKTLADRNTTLQDITSFVSHQLRAPVTAMRWSIESMLDGESGPVGNALKKELQQLHDVAIQNGKLIDDILNVSRIDRGVIEVKTEPVQLADIAERALRDYRVALKKAGLSLAVVGPKKAITVQADLEKMAEAVTNAISNAIKHTKSGGITVTLRSDDRFGYIDVTDTGEGMPPEILQNLFSRTGVKGSNTDSSKSTGLGLYIARNFVQLQGGDITVTSTVGKGSTFTYSVPLAKTN